MAFELLNDLFDEMSRALTWRLFIRFLEHHIRDAAMHICTYASEILCSTVMRMPMGFKDSHKSGRGALRLSEHSMQQAE